MIKLEHLRYLLELNKTDSFRQCAERLHCSQPAISLAIKNLEKELGVQLITRTNTSIQLTDIGVEVAKQAKKIWAAVSDITLLAQAAHCEDVVSEAAPHTDGMSFYADDTTLSFILPMVLFRLHQDTQEMKIVTKESSPEETVQALAMDPNALGLHFFWEDELTLLQAHCPQILLETLCDIHYYLVYADRMHAPFERKAALQLNAPAAPGAPIPLVMYGRSGHTTWDVMAELVDRHHAELIFSAPEEPLFHDYIRQGFAAGLILQYGEIKPFTKIKDREHLHFIPLVTDRRCYFCSLAHPDMPKALYERILEYLQFSVHYL